MILVDANLLLYAHDRGGPLHADARHWWDSQLSGAAPVCLCWSVISAFLRISTSARIYQTPLALEEATEQVAAWLNQPCVRIIHATERHWQIFREMLVAGQATANLVPDAHLAALAFEHGCELQSTDGDFSRFPRLSWRNPLAKR